LEKFKKEESAGTKRNLYKIKWNNPSQSLCGNGSLLEVNNIQCINTLASGAPVMASGDAQSLSQGPLPSGHSQGYLYHAPPPPPPPVVPMTPYSCAAWGVQQALPPPPMPPSLPPGTSSYYNAGGRQPHQRYQ